MNQVRRALDTTEIADDAAPDPVAPSPPEEGVGVEVVEGSKTVEGRRVLVVEGTTGVDVGGM